MDAVGSSGRREHTLLVEDVVAAGDGCAAVPFRLPFVVAAQTIAYAPATGTGLPMPTIADDCRAIGNSGCVSSTASDQ